MPNILKCVFGCRKKRLLFRFPENEERRIQWFKATKMEYSIKKSLCLCAKHFSSIMQTRANRLKKDAWPDQYLRPATTDDESDDDRDEVATSDDEVAIDYNELYSDGAAAAKRKTHDPLNAKRKRDRKRLATPMATLEMKLTTEEWLKVDELPKLPKLPSISKPVVETVPVYETKKIIAYKEPTKTVSASADVVAPVRLPPTIKLPKGITIKKATALTKTALKNVEIAKTNILDSSGSAAAIDWENQAKKLRAKVEEKLKNFTDTKNHEQIEQEFLHDDEIIVHETVDLADAPTEAKIETNFEELICDENMPSDDNISESRFGNIHPTENFVALTSNIRVYASETSNAASSKLQDCGTVKHSYVDNTFLLTCFWCSKVYQLPNWAQFVEHLTYVHDFKSVLTTAKPFGDLDANTKSFEENAEDDMTTDQVAFENCLLENISNDFQVCEDSKGTKDDPETSCSENDDEPQNTAVLNLQTNEPARILKFLETLHSNALLWHIRRLEPDMWDHQARKFLAEFDTKMSIQDFRSSMNNLHAFYERRAEPSDNPRSRLQKNVQKREYFKKLQEIEKLSESYAYHCDECSFYYLDEQRLATHKYTKHGIGELPYACSCGIHFESAEKKTAHENMHKSKSTYICEHCGAKLSSKSALQNHRLTKHADCVENLEEHQCTECEAKFALKYSLHTHMRAKHRPPRFKCEKCGKTFRAAFNYKSHIRMHLNQRDFVCEDCGKGFFDTKGLRNHQMVVHQQSYRCRPCYEHFATNEQLNKHNEKYHPNGTNFDRVRNHRRQMALKKREESGKMDMRHKERRVIKCKQCGIRFERIRELLKHKRDTGHRLGERRYQCPHCESVLGSELTFHRHLNYIHKLPVRYADMKNYKPISEEDSALGYDEAKNIVECTENVVQEIQQQEDKFYDEMYVEYLSEAELPEEV